MRSIAIVLLLGVFIAHDTANWLSTHSLLTPAAIFYMLQGWWTVVLSFILLIFISCQTPSIWRDVSVFALIVSIVEGIEIPACRLAVRDIRFVPQGTNLCDYATGLPVGATTTTLYVAILAWMIGSRFWNGRET